MLNIDLLASGIGIISGLYQKQLEYKHQQRLAELKAVNDDLANARTHKFSFARRFVMICLTLYLFIFPIIAAWFQMPILIGIEESNGWFSALFNGSFDFVFKTLPAGYPFLPIQLYLGTMAFTFYFGRGGS